MHTSVYVKHHVYLAESACCRAATPLRAGLRKGGKLKACGYTAEPPIKALRQAIACRKQHIYDLYCICNPSFVTSAGGKMGSVLNVLLILLREAYSAIGAILQSRTKRVPKSNSRQSAAHISHDSTAAQGAGRMPQSHRQTDARSTQATDATHEGHHREPQRLPDELIQHAIRFLDDPEDRRACRSAAPSLRALVNACITRVEVRTSYYCSACLALDLGSHSA